MFSDLSQFNLHSEYFFTYSKQKLDNNQYQEYLAYIYHITQDQFKNKEVFYTSKIILDKIIDDLSNQELSLLSEKDQFFLRHITLNSLKLHKEMSEQTLLQMESNLNGQYEPTDNDFFFVEKIKIYLDEAKDIVSPFYYLESTKNQIVMSMADKINMILLYMVSDHRFYMISSGLIYGLSLKWLLLKKYNLVCEPLQQFLGEFQTQKQEFVLKKIEQTMQQINEM